MTNNGTKRTRKTVKEMADLEWLVCEQLREVGGRMDRTALLRSVRQVWGRPITDGSIGGLLDRLTHEGKLRVVPHTTGQKSRVSLELMAATAPSTAPTLVEAAVEAILGPNADRCRHCAEPGDHRSPPACIDALQRRIRRLEEGSGRSREWRDFVVTVARGDWYTPPEADLWHRPWSDQDPSARLIQQARDLLMNEEDPFGEWEDWIAEYDATERRRTHADQP